MRHHTSFLLRCWDLDERDERVEIEHIQRSATVTVRSLDEAIEWIRQAHHNDQEDTQQP